MLILKWTFQIYKWQQFIINIYKNIKINLSAIILPTKSYEEHLPEQDNFFLYAYLIPNILILILILILIDINIRIVSN